MTHLLVIILRLFLERERGCFHKQRSKLRSHIRRRRAARDSERRGSARSEEGGVPLTGLGEKTAELAQLAELTQQILNSGRVQRLFSLVGVQIGGQRLECAHSQAHLLDSRLNELVQLEEICGLR